MIETKRSVLTAIAVVVGSGLLIAGNSMRDRVDNGSMRQLGGSLPMEGLVASREQTPDVPEGAFFREIVQLLKREYVDSLGDESKMAAGAVRGMVQSLEDSESLFLDAEEFAALEGALAGRYEGVGVDLVINLEAVDEPTGDAPNWKVPQLSVGGVVPGGPADLAGVRVGDWVQSVDGQWVPSALEIQRFRDSQKRFMDGKITESEFRAEQKAMRAKTERSLSALKARKKLTVGATGSLDVVWNRNERQIETRLERATLVLPSVKETADGVTLHFQPGAEDALERAVRGKQSVTLDLRGNAIGDYATMRACLGVVAKAGSYGTVSGGPVREQTHLKVLEGNPSPPTLRLLVDSGTRGASEIFALALASQGAKLVGGKMAGAPYVVETVRLPSGGGYTLVTGEYVREPTKEAKGS